MKKIVVKILILLCLMTVTIYTIIQLTSLENNYNLAIIDKHRILTDTETPKIVLAGGSNLAFGIDSKVIHQRFHIPVVNMGVHAGFGLGRILDDVSPFLRPGDYLLVIPEYDHFTSVWNGESAAYDLIFDARQYRLLSSSYYEQPKGFSDYFAAHLSVFIANMRAPNPLAYSRDGFNEYGDYVKHLEMVSHDFEPFENVGTLNQTYLNHFFQFIDYFTKNGITVLLSYPCYEEQSFNNSAMFIQELDAVFRTKENLSVISTPEDYCFPANFFYDMTYHLNREGRTKRTEQLIQDLQASGLFMYSGYPFPYHFAD